MLLFEDEIHYASKFIFLQYFPRLVTASHWPINRDVGYSMLYSFTSLKFIILTPTFVRTQTVILFDQL